MTLLSGVLAFWNYHLAPKSAQIRTKTVPLLCVYIGVSHTG